jgi:quercetin dioxygenase-like cupin family protein
MKSKSHPLKCIEALVVVSLLASTIPVVLAGEPGKVAPLLTQPLPDLPGREVTMITVSYPPGGSDVTHRHNADTFVYVLEGSIIMQVKGGKEVTLHPGDTFYENPKDIHLVGRNASTTEPAKFLVFFVKKEGAPLLIPVAQ